MYARIYALLYILSISVFVAPFSVPVEAIPPFNTFSEVPLFTPPANYADPRTLYARTVLLNDGTLLATWENYSPQPPLVYFPIFRSTNGGESWAEIAHVTDQVNNWGLRYQPFLYELPEAIGGFGAGTILLAGNSVPANPSYTQIDLYASTDKGYTWTFVSHVASGGEAIPDNGLTPVWEPFLMVYKNELIAFYSDQRDPAHGQKLVHQTSADLRTWSAPTDDVAYANYTSRPGMTTVTPLPNGDYMMTYEYGGGPTADLSVYSFPAYYRIASSPLAFNTAQGLPIISKDGTQPQSSPYIAWTPVGGANGTIAVSTGNYSEIFVNQALGAHCEWVKVPTPESISYSRHLRVMPGNKHLLIMGAGLLLPSTNNSVTVSVIDLEESLKGAKLLGSLKNYI
ncbi:hypothetical protein MMC17_009933 [Xylographa soralifera]|nr:hypothetical protein [Xylographa soralifera]